MKPQTLQANKDDTGKQRSGKKETKGNYNSKEFNSKSLLEFKRESERIDQRIEALRQRKENVDKTLSSSMMANSPLRGDKTLNSTRRSSSKKKNLEDVAKEFEERVLQGLNNSSSKKSASINRPEEEKVLATYSQKSKSNQGSALRSHSQKRVPEKTTTPLLSKSQIQEKSKPTHTKTMNYNVISGDKIRMNKQSKMPDTMGAVPKKKVLDPLQSSISQLKNKTFVQEVREAGVKNIIESKNKARQTKVQQVNELKNELTQLKQQRDEQAQIEIEKKKRQKLIRELEKEEMRHAKLIKKLEADVNRAGGEMKKLIKMKNDAEEFLGQIAELKNKNNKVNDRSLSSKYTKSIISSVDLEGSNSYSGFSAHRSRRKKKSASRRGSNQDLLAGRRSARTLKGDLSNSKRSKSSKLLNQTTKSNRSISKSDLKSSLKKARLFDDQNDNVDTSRSASQRKMSTSIKSTSSNKKVSFDPRAKPVQTPNFQGERNGKPDSLSSNNQKNSRSQSSASFFEIGKKNYASRRSTDFYKPDIIADQSIRVEEFETLGKKPDSSKIVTIQSSSGKSLVPKKRKDSIKTDIPVDQRIVHPDTLLVKEKGPKIEANKPTQSAYDTKTKPINKHKNMGNISLRSNAPEDMQVTFSGTAILPAIPEKSNIAQPKVTSLKAKQSDKEIPKLVPTSNQNLTSKSIHQEATKFIPTKVEEPKLTVIIIEQPTKSESYVDKSEASEKTISFKKPTIKSSESLRSTSTVPVKVSLSKPLIEESSSSIAMKSHKVNESKNAIPLNQKVAKKSNVVSEPSIQNIPKPSAAKFTVADKKEPTPIKVKQPTMNSKQISQPTSQPTQKLEISKPKLTTGVTTLAKVASSSLKENSSRSTIIEPIGRKSEQIKSAKKTPNKIISLEEEWAKKRPPKNPRKPPTPKSVEPESVGATQPLPVGLTKSSFWLKFMKTESVPAPPPYHKLLDLSHPAHQIPIPPPLTVVAEFIAIREKKAKEEYRRREEQRLDSRRNKHMQSSPNRNNLKSSGKKAPSPTMSPNTNHENSQFDGFNDSNLSRITYTTRNLDESADLLRTIYEFRKSSNTLQ